MAILISVAVVVVFCVIYRKAIKSTNRITLIIAEISFSIGIAGVTLTALVLYIQGNLDLLRAPLLAIVGFILLYQLLQIIPACNDLKPPT